MLIKFIWDKENSLWLQYDGIYNVFSIEIGKQGTKKFYIKWDSNYVYPFEDIDVSIIDPILWDWWYFGVNNLEDIIIWPKEIFQIENFWEKHFNDDENCSSIVNKYLNASR